jgi:transposase
VPWRDLPEKHGKWLAVYRRFRRWSEAGIWEAVAMTLAQAMANNSRHSIGSTTIRSHVSVAGAKGVAIRRLARSRGGFIFKVHCLSDAVGIPLAFHLASGEAHDSTAFEDVRALAEEKPAYLLADKSYDSNAIRAALRTAGHTRPRIAPSSHSRF